MTGAVSDAQGSDGASEAAAQTGTTPAHHVDGAQQQQQSQQQQQQQQQSQHQHQHADATGALSGGGDAAPSDDESEACQALNWPTAVRVTRLGQVCSAAEAGSGGDNKPPSDLSAVKERVLDPRLLGQWFQFARYLLISS